MEVGTTDQGLAPLLEHALLNALAVSIGARIDLAGHLQPDEVADLLIGDLFFDHLGAPIRIGTEDIDRVDRPAIIALLASGEGLAVLRRVPRSGVAGEQKAEQDHLGSRYEDVSEFSVPPGSLIPWVRSYPTETVGAR